MSDARLIFRKNRIKGQSILVVYLLLAVLQGACVPKEQGKAEIFWETWGVPHIFAENDTGLLYAFGWAQMKSHGNLILKLYGEARGRTAEYWGESYLMSDRITHTLSIPKFPRIWYEAHFKTKNIDTYGATLVGMPTLCIGFNNYLGWTHTVNTFDGVDLYELALTQNGYLYDGEEKSFETADTYFNVKQPDGTLREERMTLNIRFTARC